MRRTILSVALFLLAFAACARAALEGGGDAPPALSPEDESSLRRWKALPAADRARIDALLDGLPKPPDIQPLSATTPPPVRTAILAMAREGQSALDALAARRLRDPKDLRLATFWNSLSEMTIREARILSACRIALGWAPPAGFPEALLPRDAIQEIRQNPVEFIPPAEAKALLDAFAAIVSGKVLPGGGVDRFLAAKGARWVLELEFRLPADPARASIAADLLEKLYAPEFERAAREEVSAEQAQSEKANVATFPLLIYPGSLLSHKPVYLSKREFYLRDLAFHAGPAAARGMLASDKTPLETRIRVSRALVAAGIRDAIQPIKRWRGTLSPKKDADLWRELSIALWLLGDPSGAGALKDRYEAGAGERRKSPLASELQTVPFLIAQLEAGDDDASRLAAEALETRTGRKPGPVEPRAGETKAEALGRDWREWWEKNQPTFEVDDEELGILREILENIDPSMQSDRARAGK